MISKRKILVLGLLYFGLMIAYAGVNAYQGERYRQSTPGWEAYVSEGRLFVRGVHSSGPAAGVLQRGDEIVAYQGRPLGSLKEVDELSRPRPGTEYALAYRRGDQTREVHLTTSPLPPTLQLFFELLSYPIPAIFLFTGLAVFLLKPDDKQALVVSLMFGSFVIPLFRSFEALPLPAVIVLSAGSIVYSFFWPLFFHSFLIFPERSPLFRRYPRLEFYLYLPVLLVVLPLRLIFLILLAAEPERVNVVSQNFTTLMLVLDFLLPCIYLTAGVMSLLVNYRHANRQSRRKLRVVVVGCLAAFLPFVAFAVVVFTSVQLQIRQAFFPWLAVLSVGAFALFPLSFAYAVIRHQVIPMRVIIRRGIRYVFVSRGSIAVETIVMFIVVGVCLKGFFAYFESRGQIVGIVSTAAGVIAWNLTSYLHHRMVAPVIDRRFFRRAYDAQQIFTELGTALRVMNDAQEATALVTRKIQDALQTENVIIFLRDAETGDYVRATSAQFSGRGRGRILEMPGEDSLLRHDGLIVDRLRESSYPLTVDFDDPSSWVRVLVTLNVNRERKREYQTLKKIKSALLLPVATKEQMHGIISLGPRLGDLPFSREDKMLLGSLAWQLAYVIENSELVERKIEEERLRHELEMATEVQQRLFPEKPPAMEGLELAGVCYPARGVGGDYYDFLPLPNGRLGLAVADVAGKGMSAALVMSIVQASLRSQAEAVDGDLRELVSSMNRLLHHSTRDNSYATFFYAEYEPRGRRLTYVNAGHNPPLLLRGREINNLAVAVGAGVTQSGELAPAFAAKAVGTPASPEPVELLLTGGTVMGLFADCAYEQEKIDLEPDDLLIAYTDGVSEALNVRGEEFGTDQLQEIALASAGLPAEEIKERIIKAVSDWCQDEPQHDDITLVVMKVV
ncbi:MAG TPA: SpoIIE family protein phosphatase [Pyrinomonadaceae bacterium]|nr:SpoIIE family protein phosphatase [Pyrinomonadaceae bacterium]